MHTLDNPLAVPPAHPRSTDDAAFVASQLNKKDAAAMRRLLGKQPAKTVEAPEDLSSSDEDLELSLAEHADLAKDKVISEIMTREASVLQKFFNREFQVPPLPEEATTERIAEWRESGFELHYLPTISLIDITIDPSGAVTEVKPKNIRGWKKKPQEWFFTLIKAGKLPKEAAELKGGWVLVDTRPKPNYDDGKQMYPDDPLAVSLAELNRQGLIQQTSYDGKTKLPPDSRFGITPRELANPEVRKKLGEVLGIESGDVSLQQAIEFNILGNLHHPEWGDTNTSEWFADQYGAGSRQLYGGLSVGGGLSFVDSRGLDGRRDFIGFRLLGRFSSRKEEDVPVAGGGR